MQQLKDMLNGMAAKPKPVEETLEPIRSVDVPLEDVYKRQPKGPSRKYYVVTEEGRQALLEFRQDWSQLCQLVEKIFKEEPDE